MASIDPLSMSPPASPAAAAATPGAGPHAPRHEQTPARRSRRPHLLLDGILAGAVVVLAFLAASFVARNSDLWQHLASGRLLLEGKYRFGVDPFAYTTEGIYWTNHSWLLDALSYLLYGAAGGAGLVAAKALLVAALAGLMLAIGRRGSGWAAPAACTAVAIVAMSPRLLLQPACVSFFLLGLCLWLLWRPHQDKETRRQGDKETPGQDQRQSPCLLVSWSPCLVFVLWVNLDGWFFLGPLLAGLFWLGERPGGERRTPGWLAPAGLALCLLNPHHFHAFTPPAEFSPALWTGLARDVRFQRLFASPWQVGAHLPASTVNLGEWAYFLLVLLGIASFALHRDALRTWRLPVWLGFGLLGAWQVRTVPFFAVVAGPVAALNLQDFLARQSIPRAAGRAARWGLLAAAVVLVVLRPLGWLHGFSGDVGRIGWGVQADPSLERVSRTLGRWRQEGRLRPGERVFNFHPDLAHCWAWFCPEEKGFFDFRFPFFSRVVADYESVCRALGPAGNAGPPGGDWQAILREHGVTHLVLYDPDPRRLTETMSGLDRAGDWALLHIDGKAVVYGWKASGEAFPDYKAHAERLALAPRGPEDEDEMPPAPARGPTRGPRPRTPWDGLLHAFEPEPAPTWEAAAATACLCFHGDRGDPQSPALPLLAVRQARRALAVNPDDALAWLHLGQAYLALGRGAVEKGREGELPPLAMLRHVQTVTALENALLLNPGLGPAHEYLTQLYRERRCLDAAVEHQRAALALARRSGPLPGESDEAFAARLEQTERQVREQEHRVQDLRNLFAVRSGELGDDARKKALLARDLGLARQALDVVRSSQALLFGPEALELEATLLLTLGRAEEVRQFLGDEDIRKNRDKLGVTVVPAPPPLREYRFPAYAWLAACQAAAVGDYDLAEEQIQESRSRLDREARGKRQAVQRGLPWMLAWELGVRAAPQALLVQSVACRERLLLTSVLTGTHLLRVESADLGVVAGLLALERGRPELAERHLREADRLSRDLAAETGPTANGRPLALAYLRRIEAARAAEGKRRDEGQ
jgi:tetratricopeptide (TPR) repeat protein